MYQNNEGGMCLDKLPLVIINKHIFVRTLLFIIPGTWNLSMHYNGFSTKTLFAHLMEN